ncbi:MAG: hypothetical protein IJ058_06690 [Lachnospiraceae bacterium]|nr:hypothetical protein [Lachnospiraceae bacterium]
MLKKTLTTIGLTVMMIAGTATVALAAPAGNGGFGGNGGPAGGQGGFGGQRMEQQFNSGDDQSTPPELPSGEMPQWNGDQSAPPELPDGTDMETGESSLEGTENNRSRGQKPDGTAGGQRPDGMGRGQKGMQTDIVSGISEAISAVEDEVTQAGLQTLLDTYTAALDAEKEALDADTVDKEALSELRSTTEEARSALLEALSDAGVDTSAYERPARPDGDGNENEKSLGGHAGFKGGRPETGTKAEEGDTAEEEQPAFNEGERPELPEMNGENSQQDFAAGSQKGAQAPDRNAAEGSQKDEQSSEKEAGTGEKIGFFKSISNWFKNLFNK